MSRGTRGSSLIPFHDRADAGRALAARLKGHAPRSDAIVLGLARGGVPVAHQVASGLGLPLDVLLVRKLGVPGHEELAMGAIASGGIRVIHAEVVRAYSFPPGVIEEVTARERAELLRREDLYRRGGPAAEVAGKTAIVVDDGLATGSTMRAAVAALRARGVAAIVAAAPVAAADTAARLAPEVDAVVCVATPEPFGSVGAWYEDFTQTTDDEVRRLLAQAPRSSTMGGAGFEPA